MRKRMANIRKFVIALALHLSLVAAGPSCDLNLNAMPTWLPLMWKDNSMLYPKETSPGQWAVSIPLASDFQIGCGDVTLLNTLSRSDIGLEETTVNCDSNGNLAIQLSPPGVTPILSQLVTFPELGCKKAPKEVIIQNGTCYNSYTAIDIRYDTLSGSIPLIKLCHNSAEDNTVYTSHVIRGGALNDYEISNNRPSFKSAQFYPTTSPSTAYNQNQQLTTVESLVGSSTLAATYIDSSKSFYFARGHLAPDGDFVHVYEQNATYYYVNVIPQWQAINNGNWKAMEVAIRNYAINKKVNLNVWTGGKGVMKLNDVNGTPVDIYLTKSKDASGSNKIPVPQMAWKAVHDPVNKKAIAVIVLNNPHLTGVSPSDIICPDICDQLPWVTWDRKNIKKGYTYCCTYTNLRKSLSFLPSVGTVGMIV